VSLLSCMSSGVLTNGLQIGQKKICGTMQFFCACSVFHNYCLKVCVYAKQTNHEGNMQ